MVILCVAVLGVIRWRTARPYNAQRLLSVLPARDAALVYVDIAALRDGGILDLIAGSRTAEEADYRRFVDETGFDYRTDLDAASAALVGNESYFVLRGRFQWKQLENYAISQGGECHYTVCSMPASAADRSISFFPLLTNVLALAVSPDPKAVTRIGIGANKDGNNPASPVWILFPSAVLSRADSLLPGLREFLAPLARTRKTILTAGLKGDALQIGLEVSCNSAGQAAQLTKQLSDITNLLKDARSPESAAAAGLGRLASSGTFQQRDTEVVGWWPVDRTFLDQLIRQ